MDLNSDNTRQFSNTIENLITEPGQLRTCPIPYKLTPGAHYTIGDLHGNAVNLLSFLIKEGFLELDTSTNSREEVMELLIRIYEEPLSAENKILFDTIIKNATVHANASLCFIGDETADRGSNDYFILKIIEKLGQNQIKIDILLSNHGLEFLRFRDQNYYSYFTARLGPGQGRSAENLAQSIAEGIVTKEELTNIVEKYYIPNLKAIAYATSTSNFLVIYTHALIGLDTIKSLSNKFGVHYSDKTIAALTTTIDKINAVFSGLLETKELVRMVDQEYYEIEGTGFLELKNASLKYPLTRLIWNRLNYEDSSFDKEKILAFYNGFEIHHVHGHDGMGKVRPDHANIVKNLDHTNGKFGLDHPGLYLVHVFNNYKNVRS